MDIGSVWKAIWLPWRGTYTRGLEEEVARLRAENLALVNSILGVAGIPPMRFGNAGAKSAFRGGVSGSASAIGSIGRNLASGSSTVLEGHINRRGRKGLTSVPIKSIGTGRELPVGTVVRTGTEGAALRGVRRRSWQQIGRALEVEDALALRRERESDAETFPVPRNVVIRESA